ncbi:MAG: carcinine hydrolase/isopenicillin-N N-acyltransferase family protein [Myxococcales bacterium]|jgi:dipeptidase
MVVVPEQGPVWFAKNSDREPSEAQFVECHDDSAAQGLPLGLPLDSARLRTIVSRPAWMWGCEMGVNEHGLAIGNEAVFTKIPVPKSGYTGMDFQRVVLTNNRTADEALEHLIELTEQLVQGGVMGHRHHRFRYHSSFLIADPTTAWVLETAGHYWAAKRVRGVATISNALTIEDDFDLIHTGAYPSARERGWVKSAKGFGFASAFSNPVMSVLAGAPVRRSCTAHSLAGVVEPNARSFIAALTDHGAVEPGKGLRSESPCAHASWLPTRTAAQTTASVIARLASDGPSVWATGTSSPCLSVFKPAPFDSDLLSPRPIADARFDERELWWAHERLHRACLASYRARRVAFAEELERFQDDCLSTSADPARAWREHRAFVDEWLARALEVEASPMPLPSRWFWALQSRSFA